MNTSLHPKTKQAIDNFLSKPSQAVAVIGEQWLNKRQIVNYLASELLDINKSDLDNYPYIFRVNPNEKKAIGIDAVRKINAFLSLKVPLDKNPNRLVVISDAQNLTIEAQNALLKNLEEPPTGSLLVLSSTSRAQLIPTIVSRLQIINVQRPSKESLIDHFLKHDYDSSEVSQVYLISGGLPGLMESMLDSDEHPLNLATKKARDLLSASTFERLNQVNDLAKDREAFKDILFVISQMAKFGLVSKDTKLAKRWQKILKAYTEAKTGLEANAQTKLLITNFMLSIS